MSRQNQRSLPTGWIERIFAHLAKSYGSKFLDMWAGLDQQELREHWSETLGGFADKPDAIRTALKNCEEREWPPTLPEFLLMCRRAANLCNRPADLMALPQPKADPARIRECLASANAALRGQESPIDYHRGWKWIRAQWLAGHDVPSSSINDASEVLGEVWENNHGARTIRPRATVSA